MKKATAFLNLIRWPNLFFIALSQALFQYCILVPLFKYSDTVFDTLTFTLLIISSLFIAAAGYIINDYFDVNIDQINKPNKVIVGKLISRRQAIIWHSVLSLIGIVLSFYIGAKLHIFWIGFANIGCVFLLFVYSTTFKRKLLSGNIIISALTAWSIAILGFATFYAVVDSRDVYSGISAEKVLRYTIIYAAFAFIISLIREAIKDIEDMEGDLGYGCRTLPIVAGIHAAKIYIGVWLVVLIAAILLSQIYTVKWGWWIAVIYAILLLVLPLSYLLLRLLKSRKKEEFHQLSAWTKMIMLSGILSMIFFRLYL